VKRQIIILAAMLILTACQETNGIDMSQLSEKEKQGVASLLWLNQADAKQDAQAALSKNDLRVLAMAGRVPSLPGIGPELTAKAKGVCGVRMVEGSTDSVLGETHRKLLQAASDYAAAYNQIVITHCLGK
jgi:hypothetical protein